VRVTVSSYDGELALRTHTGFTSKYLRTPHDLIVYTPPGFEDDSGTYPVLYLQDGQNLFDPSTAFGGQDWGVHTTADALIHEGAIKPLIVAGIANAGEFRIDEYTPSKDRHLGSGGKAWRYARMLIEDLKPFIDAKYPTVTDASGTGLGGSSLGGLVSLYIGLYHPDVFGKLAIMSPSVWWGNRSIIETVLAHDVQDRSRIWLDIGTNEGEKPQKTLEDVRILRDALVQKGWQEGSDLCYVEAEGATHSEASWRERVGPMLRFLFPAEE
jgi:predicted alpha/beta superfamily hydrolase